MEFDKQQADKVFEELKIASGHLLQGTGIRLTRATGRYDNLGMTITFKLTTTGDNGETIETRDYKNYAPRRFQHWLGEAILHDDGRMFEVMGWRKSARKRPVMLRNLETNAKVVSNLHFLERCNLVT